MIAQARTAGMSISELEMLVQVMETGDLEAFDADSFLAEKIGKSKPRSPDRGVLWRF